MDPGSVRKAPELSLGSGTILFVEDEEPVLEIASEMLTKLGYEVLQAKGGREALEIYEKELMGMLRHQTAINIQIRNAHLAIGKVKVKILNLEDE